LKKREEFAISLRKKKKEEILRQKRSKFYQASSTSEDGASYKECPLFCYAGLLPGRSANPSQISLRDLLNSISPFLAENFINCSDD
jgi:hypothetical protein